MAKAASTTTVQSDMKPADFRGAVQLIRTIKKKKDRVSGINGEIGKVYAQVSGDKKVNQKASKVFYALDNMEAAERHDVMQSLNGLIDAAGWPEEETDLVDQAEDNVVHMRVGGKKDDIDEALDEGDEPDDIDDALEDEEPAPGTGAAAMKAMNEKAKADSAPKTDEFEEASEEELAAQKGRAEAAAKAEVTKPKK